MTGDPTAAVVAEKLVDAYMLVCNSGYVVNDNDEMSKANICLLRDNLCSAESALRDAIVAFIGHTLAEVE